MTTKLAFNQIGGLPINVKDYGAVGDGVTDDRQALFDTNAAGGFSLPSGVYLVGSALTISSDVEFLPGARLKPASGITITVTGAITASTFFHIFDMSAGGSIQFEIGATEQAPITWFGAISDDESGTIPEDNVTAIDECIKACDVATGGDIEGDATGVFRNIPTLIPAGMFSIDNANINIPSYAVVIGLGDSSILSCKNGANSYSVFRITTGGANSIHMANFAIYGDQSNQTGTIHALEFNITSGDKAIYNNFERLMFKEIAGNAIRSVGSVNIENCSFSDSMFRDCNNHCIYISRANSCDFNNLRVRSAKSGYSGCVVDGSANNSLNFNSCRMEGNNDNGLYLTNTGGRMVVNGGSYSSNLGKGIYCDRVDNLVIDGGAIVELNTGEGITINQCDNTLIGKGILSRSNYRGIGIYSSSYLDSDLKAVSNQREGILLSASDNCNIKGSAVGNSQETNNTYNGVMIQSNSDSNNIEVFVRHGAGASQHKYGLEINDAPSTANRVTNCDLLDSGSTGSLLDSGTSTVTTAGNRT
jgi:hypothetical protein